MWEQIIGHETVKKTLINGLINDKTAHAYLFAGPKGLGKNTLAKTFAQAFFCNQGNGIPCNQCITCNNILNENYPDFKIIEPAGTSVKIEQIREIQKSCQYKPYNGIGRVYIIKDSHLMTAEAANCLLKVLEEPTPNTIFILITENPYALLPTVLSRCQKINFRPVAPQVLTEWLYSKGVELDRAKIISSLSEGIPVKALALISEEESDNRLQIALKADKIQQGDIISVFKIAEEMEKNKEGILEELSHLAIWYRDMLVWAKTGDEKLLINADLIAEIKKQVMNLGLKRLSEDLTQILKTKKIIQTNANLRLCLENLLLKLRKSA